MDNTRLLDCAGRKFSQRVHWILSGFKNWDDARLHCANCGKTLDDPKFFRSPTIGYNRYCCKACSNKHELTRAKSRSTRLASNGGSYFSKASIEKRRKTCLKKYGADSNMKSIAGLNKYKRSLMERYGVDNQFKRQAVI